MKIKKKLWRRFIAPLPSCLSFFLSLVLPLFFELLHTKRSRSNIVANAIRIAARLRISTPNTIAIIVVFSSFVLLLFVFSFESISSFSPCLFLCASSLSPLSLFRVPSSPPSIGRPQPIANILNVNEERERREKGKEEREEKREERGKRRVNNVLYDQICSCVCSAYSAYSAYEYACVILRVCYVRGVYECLCNEDCVLRVTCLALSPLHVNFLLACCVGCVDCVCCAGKRRQREEQWAPAQPPLPPQLLQLQQQRHQQQQNLQCMFFLSSLFSFFFLFLRCLEQENNIV